MVGDVKIIPVILSGGAGSRLWPASRQAVPKQLLPLVTEQTMVQETAERFSGELFHPPVFICNAAHGPQIKEQMAAINMPVGAIIVEPIGRNTAPCAVVAALHAQISDPEALILLAPADHHVTKPCAFRRAVAAAMTAAQNGRLVTIFLFSPQALLSEMMKFHADIVEHAKDAYLKATLKSGQIDLDAESFAACPSESIDYAVMEPTDQAAVVPADIGWNDIGSFTSLHALKKGDNGNAIQGDVIAYDTVNSLIETDGPLVTTVGMDGFAVIVKDGSILVAKLDAAQDVKKIVETLQSLLTHRRFCP